MNKIDYKSAYESVLIANGMLRQQNKELKEDLKFVLEQVLGAFIQNWCIDWNFNDIRKKYNISDKYDWNSDVDD